jgi:hypothetical protein
MSTAPCFLSNGTFTCAYNDMSLTFVDKAALIVNQFIYYDWVTNYRWAGLLLLRNLLLPLFFAYLFRPKAAEVHIHVKQQETDLHIQRENDDEESLLDELDNRIIEQLKKRESGTTARMLTLALRSSYPELELADMDDRLNILQSKGLVSGFKGQLRAPLWVAN